MNIAFFRNGQNNQEEDEGIAQEENQEYIDMSGEHAIRGLSQQTLLRAEQGARYVIMIQGSYCYITTISHLFVS